MCPSRTSWLAGGAAFCDNMGLPLFGCRNPLTGSAASWQLSACALPPVPNSWWDCRRTAGSQHSKRLRFFCFKSQYFHWFCSLLLSVYPAELSCSALGVSSHLCCFVVVCVQYKYRQFKGSSSALFLRRSAEFLSSIRVFFPLHLSFCICVFFLIPLFILRSENKTSLLFKTRVLLCFRIFSVFMLFKLHLEELMNKCSIQEVSCPWQSRETWEKHTSEIVLHDWMACVNTEHNFSDNT